MQQRRLHSLITMVKWKPNMHCGFESTAHELGLQFSIENYNKAMEAYNIESALSEMQPPLPPEDDDENEGLL